MQLVTHACTHARTSTYMRGKGEGGTRPSEDEHVYKAAVRTQRYQPSAASLTQRTLFLNNCALFCYSYYSPVSARVCRLLCRSSRSLSRFQPLGEVGRACLDGHRHAQVSILNASRPAWLPSIEVLLPLPFLATASGLYARGSRKRWSKYVSLEMDMSGCTLDAK
eukprot:6196387-Pleurochrysis_carterae.AAC.1